MAASKVPKFGSWEGGDNYTVYFDNARKKKNNGQIITPNDPEYYPEMFQQNGGPAQGPRPDSKGQKTTAPLFGDWDNEENEGYTVYFENARKTKHGDPTVGKNNKNGRPVNLETSDAPKVNRDVGESPAKEGHSKVPQFGDWNGEDEAQYTAYFDNFRKNKNVGPVEPQLNRDINDRARPPSAGGPKYKSDQNYYQLRNSSRGSNSSESALRYGKQNPGGQSPLHQKGGKLQQRPPAGRGSQTPERGAAIPAWGVWNTDPQQAEGFTGAFTRAKEERNTPLNANIPPRYHQQPNKDDSKKGCCFGWF